MSSGSHVQEATRADRDRLVLAHLGLARHIARRFARAPDEREEITQVAYTALVAAAGRYDPAVGEFSRFAFTSIAGEIKRHRRDSSWFIRVPRSVQEAYLEVEQATDHLTQRLGRSPTPRELAGETGLDIDTVLEALDAGSVRAIPDAAAEVGAPDDTDRVADRLAVIDGLGDLDAEDRELLGLYYAEELSQREIGRRIGVSQAHVHRRLARALDRLRGSIGEGGSEDAS